MMISVRDMTRWNGESTSIYKYYYSNEKLCQYVKTYEIVYNEVCVDKCKRPKRRCSGTNNIKNKNRKIRTHISFDYEPKQKNNEKSFFSI